MTTRRIRAAALAAVVLAGWTGAPTDARAQDGSQRWQDASWVDDLNFAGANVLIGGLTGGVVRKLRGGSFADGFTRGALGGAVVYAGKRTSVARFTAAGLLGREIGALGASITRSAAFGTGVLDTLVLPLGPLRAYVPTSGGGWFMRVDVVEASGLVYALREDRLDFSLRRSLESGVAVFTTPRGFGDQEGDRAVAQAWPGFIALSRRGGLGSLGHERVHVVQGDFAKIAIGLPFEDWVARVARVRGLPLVRYVDFGIGEQPLMMLASQSFWGRPRSLLEVEADFLETR